MNERVKSSREYSTLEDILLPDWDGALCAEVDPGIFFPGDSDSGSSKKAKSICMECSIRIKCLDFAVENNIDHGVWGGMSAVDRRRIRRMLKNAS
jgi:WhiB family transcriptional regulator, redox-sensing transcriptional regulator